jgi:hypothetical protein
MTIRSALTCVNLIAAAGKNRLQIVRAARQPRRKAGLA